MAIKLHFSSSNISNALDVFRKLRPRKYKYKEYITTIVDVLFLPNLSNIQLRIGHSQLNLFCYINSTVKYFEKLFFIKEFIDFVNIAMVSKSNTLKFFKRNNYH